MALQLAVAAEAEELAGVNLFIPALYDIVWSLVPFALLLFFFARFAVPRITKVLDERAAAIEGGITRAEEVQKEADAKLAEYNNQLEEARDEAARIRDQARQDAVKIASEVKDNATAESARIIANANSQIEAERQSALVSLRTEVGSLALDLAGGILGESLSSDTKAKSVVDQFVKELEKSDAQAGKKA